MLLPNISGVVAAFFALQAEGRIPAMLNFSVGVGNMKSACNTAEIKTVVTARAFIEQAKLDGLIATLQAQSIRIVCLEGLASKVSLFEKLWASLTRRRA